jgi:uncharacterized protein (TIGR02231 family)
MRLALEYGQVELARESGFVGWTDVPFIAKGERFELGFGPDASLRVVRSEKQERKVDAVDKWTRVMQRVSLHLSNLSGFPKEVTVTERIPVSRVEHVRVELSKERATPGASPDSDGFVTWRAEIGPSGQTTLVLVYTVACAPGVSLT